MTQGTKRSFSSYTYGEVKTGGGQLVQFTCPVDLREAVEEFLAQNVRSLTYPETHRVNVEHGGYGQCSRFEIKQHKYAGGDGESGGWCYVEVLEIKNAPAERCGFIVHNNTSSSGASFTEWETLKDARGAYKVFMRKQSQEKKDLFSKLPGFKRFVHCGDLTPWFYAIGNRDLVGDYTFPEYMQDDQVFSFGKKFIVFGKENVPVLKTCLGCRFVGTEQVRGGFYTQSHTISAHRIAYWDDGTCWNESQGSSERQPIPAEDGELWIAEAISQFRNFLTGKSEHFVIDFIDGNKFSGRLVKPSKQKISPEGTYFLKVKIQGSSKILQGSVDFTPTPESPNVNDFVTKKYQEGGKIVENITIENSKATPKGKKWHGVYFTRSIPLVI